MNEVIEKMKNNLATFGNLDRDTQDFLYTVPCDVLLENGNWVRKTSEFHRHDRYRIAPEYQPEPEIPFLEGYRLETIKGRTVLVYGEDIIGITEAPNILNFAGYGYWLKGKKEIVRTGSPIIYTNQKENSFSLTFLADVCDIPLRPSWVVFKETEK
jgi:hypothetical protein